MAIGHSGVLGVVARHPMDIVAQAQEIGADLALILYRNLMGLIALELMVDSVVKLIIAPLLVVCTDLFG